MKRSDTELLRDYALYVAIAVSFIVGVLIFAIYAPRSWWFPMRWGGLGVYTATVFWIPLRECRRYWRKTRFWIAFVLLLILHTVGFIQLLKTINWALTYYIPCSAIEGPLIYAVLVKIGKS